MPCASESWSTKIPVVLVAKALSFFIYNRLLALVPAPSYDISTRPPAAVEAKLVPPASILIA